MMGVSRITVRKALQTLSEAGVIETRKGKGSFVAVDASELAPASMDLKKYCESFVQATKARLLLEPAIARQAAQTATPEELEQLRKNVHTALPMDHFHDVLVEMVHNPLVTDWIQQSHRLETDPTLSALIPPARQRSMSPQLEAQHQKIYEAIPGPQERARLFLHERAPRVRVGELSGIFRHVLLNSVSKRQCRPALPFCVLISGTRRRP